jgi:hypothetical protein
VDETIDIVTFPGEGQLCLSSFPSSMGKEANEEERPCVGRPLGEADLWSPKPKIRYMGNCSSSSSTKYRSKQ